MGNARQEKPQGLLALALQPLALSGTKGLSRGDKVKSLVSLWKGGFECKVGWERGRRSLRGRIPET